MTQSALEAGREAAGRYAWSEALDLLTGADTQQRLEPDDLMLLAESAWWMGKMRDCIAARERAHAAYLAEGQPRRAAYVALKLVDHHSDLAERGIAAAWMQSASKLLAPEEECVEHGYLSLMRTFVAGMEGDLDGVASAAGETRRIGQRFGDKDLMAFGLAIEGMALVQAGEVDRGIVLLEEATVPAVSGELGPYATGWIYCIMIGSTSGIADWQRAGQWAEAAKRWCDRQAISGFPGVCRVHRAEIMRLRGSLSDAEEEARIATEELGTFNLVIASSAFKELGEIRLRTGDLDAAEAAFRQANELGAMPQPGMALVQFRRGKIDAAANSLKRALADEGIGRLERAKILPTVVEVALAAGDREAAASAAAELVGLAEVFKTPAMHASAATAGALLKLADGELAPAEVEAKRARRLWKEADVLYEAARTGLVLGDIYLAEGDRDGAAFEYTTALFTFEKFGAVPDADAARERLASMADAREPSGRRVAKTFLFSDIVRSTNLVEAIGDDAWTDLLNWHDEALRARFRELRGEEVAHTGDGFFVAFETADDAVACAVAIQRALADHRRAHGFAPQVRIGIHATEAAEMGGNYHGKGVHEAARIGALAEGGEILVSASTLECLQAPAEARDAREVTLKGVSGPVRIVSLVWRQI
jgi:class 3 adenylate cyclase